MHTVGFIPTRFLNQWSLLSRGGAMEMDGKLSLWMLFRSYAISTFGKPLSPYVPKSRKEIIHPIRSHVSSSEKCTRVTNPRKLFMTKWLPFFHQLCSLLSTTYMEENRGSQPSYDSSFPSLHIFAMHDTLHTTLDQMPPASHTLPAFPWF